MLDSLYQVVPALPRLLLQSLLGLLTLSHQPRILLRLRVASATKDPTAVTLTITRSQEPVRMFLSTRPASLHWSRLLIHLELRPFSLQPALLLCPEDSLRLISP